MNVFDSIEEFEESDRNARAYGFEIGRGKPLVEKLTYLSTDNPFMDPLWKSKMEEWNADHNQSSNYIWVVRENSDKTEGRGTMVDVAVCNTEDEAFEVNRNVSGVMGHPRNFAGDIYRIDVGSYPLKQELVFGHRKDWNDKWGQGWVDLRDKPNDDDPEWIEYQRLSKQFDPTRKEDI